ncbi:type IV secretion system DNA-binding domain-containing protein [Paraburkholderia sp. A2RO-4L]|uniref:type IV secretion system DNA-binding domain-containing protein n=1 Tax=Paraburkholderia sp. A2RO-4L TaxID=3028374 RepID=UPI003DAA2D2A
MDLILDLLGDQHPQVRSAIFGFLAYALFVVWRRASARWVNWFPPLAKIARLVLYGAAALVAVLGWLVIQDASTKGPLIWALVAVGGVGGPVIDRASRLFRRTEKVRRGAQVGKPADVNKQSAKELPSSDFDESFKIAGVNIPRSAEPYHFFVVGSTGSGKSVAITNLMDHIEARGDIALVVDSGGGFTSRYFTPGRDHIVNPFDDRCAPWSPTAELAGPWDAEALAKSMIPDGVGDSKEWNGYAQTFVTSVMRRLSEKGRMSIKDLLYYVQAASLEELTPLLAGTPAAAQLVSDKTFGSIRTIAANYLATYAYLSDNENPFSVAKFIRAEKPGFLFLSYRDDQLDSLRNMISCVLDVAARTILALPESQTRRVWLIIDEFASIGKVQSIEAVATKARKMGGCLLLGLQSVSQLQDRYGEKAAQTILSCLSSWLVLRCSDAETSEYVSKYIGDAEVSRMTRNESTSDTGGGSDGRSEQIQTQRAVMPVQLQRLKNLQGFFKLAGDYPICEVKLKFPAKRDMRAQTYAERDFIAKPMLELLSPDAQPVAVQQGDGAGAQHAPEAESAAEFVDVPAQPVMEANTLRIRKSPLEEGPAALEDILNEMAEAFESEF